MGCWREFGKVRERSDERSGPRRLPIDRNAEARDCSNNEHDVMTKKARDQLEHRLSSKLYGSCVDHGHG